MADNIQTLKVTELKPDSKYMIYLDKMQFSEYAANRLLKILEKENIKTGIALMIDGDVDNAVIIKEV